ncbi:helix-turn-helix domain-containing protein [Geodermatophilus ruber]|uniref:Transcriptional regulator, CdaR family n=1 Tax=Geodermatophilus ruber TaxID=504800 RepID=A0A1I4AGQ0_9ACTN|nr:GAF domain-containing protein [Geodermatophilus ruber]SFK55443.1 transcriptional regulator, CdaR family [Geodermatophilus ruber]
MNGPGQRPAPSDRAPAQSVVLARLLDVLADEGPVAEIDALAAQVREAPQSPDRQVLLLAAEDARRIRELLAQRERREAEMQALYETARDLTSLRDVDGALHAIVDRVRRLLGADLTYIALVDEETGDAYMRVTSGAMTAPIETVRQPRGWGIGGRVIETGQPIATADYLADPRLALSPSVAAAVREEGIVGIAGVPMKLGSQVIGALFAADRRRRTFDQAEIALLSSLANHASVVIENARLFAGVRASTEELREANARLSEQRHVLERASAAHEQLMPLALSRADLGQFAETVSRILGGAVELVDTEGRLLATADGPAGGDDDGPVPAPAVVRVRAGKEVFGSLRLTRATPLTEAEMRTLERAAQTAALLVLMERQTALLEEELRAELLDDLLADGTPDWDVVRRRAERLGVLRPGELQTLVVCSATDVPLSALLTAAGALAARSGGLASEHSGSVVVLLPGTDGGTAARTVAAELGRFVGAPVTAGASGQAATATDLHALHREAARGHRLLLALGREGDGAMLQELGIVGQLLEGATPGRVQRVVDRVLGPLTAYDAQHSAALFDTVEAYFACGQSPPEAARRLQVHVNTVYQRLERVDRVLGGTGWREPQGALEMQMALQLHRATGRAADARSTPTR